MEKKKLRDLRDGKLLYAVTFLVILLFRVAHYASQNIPSFTSDSTGYMSLDLGYLFTHFVSNVGQAPGYGFLLAVIRAVVGANYLYAVVALQMVCSFASLFALAYVLDLLGINRYLQQVLLLMYGANPGICGWDGCILTESLSLSCTVLFLFFILRYIKMGGMKNALWGGGNRILYGFPAPAIPVRICRSAAVLCAEKHF